MEIPYEVKYDSGKNKIYVFAWTFGISLLSIILMPKLLLLIGVIVFFSLIALIGSTFGYREILLFDDKLLIQDLFSRMIMEVYFDEIKHVGFLQASILSRYNSSTGANNDQMEELILLLKNSGRIQIDGGDFDEIHAVCAYIQGKIGQQ